MELVREENNEKVFIGDNKVYYMLNMGSYVGHRNRPWYAAKPQIWILMATDEKCEDGEIFHIEALVDDRGDYTRFIMQKGDIKRVIQLQSGRVYSDTINDTRTVCDSLGLGETYVALDLDIYSIERVRLGEYLESDQQFSLNGENFDGDVPSNESLKEFLSANETLRKTIKNTTIR